jgi:hypothetical protein
MDLVAISHVSMHNFFDATSVACVIEDISYH